MSEVKSAGCAICGEPIVGHHCTGSDWTWLGTNKMRQTHHGRRKYDCVNCHADLGCSSCTGIEQEASCMRCGHGTEAAVKNRGVNRDLEYEYLKKKAEREGRKFTAKPPTNDARQALSADPKALEAYDKLMGIKHGKAIRSR